MYAQYIYNFIHTGNVHILVPGLEWLKGLRGFLATPATERDTGGLEDGRCSSDRLGRTAFEGRLCTNKYRGIATHSTCTCTCTLIALLCLAYTCNHVYVQPQYMYSYDTLLSDYEVCYNMPTPTCTCSKTLM